MSGWLVPATGYTVWFHVDTVHVIDTFTLSSQRVTLGVIHMIIQVLMIRKSQLLHFNRHHEV